ncbi:MAG TPA: acyl-CoA dehydrogenase [Acidimicrobiales bacterium]|nr:acyl-CoA dehydrogenase [Acidimicrobiales bacterium]
MSLGLSDDHLALHDTARRWTANHCPAAVPRALLDADREPMAPFWGQLAGLGWLGLHLSEDVGGSGYGLPELAVVLEELGRACAPGPFLPTVLASAAIDALADDDARAALLPVLADGSATAAVQFAGPGTPVLGASLAKLVVVPTADGWNVVRAEHCTITPRVSVDETRRVADVDAADATPIAFLPDPGGATVTDLTLTLIAAECAGGAAWCVDTASEYARVREQFGRPIGQFQAVKHRCADMLLALEQARAVAWDAARPAATADEGSLAASVAGVLAPAAFFQCAKDCVQVLGGIGFTWEHDAHLYLKRATALRSLTGGGPHQWRARTLELARRGARRTLAVDLPVEAEAIRDEIRADLADLTSHDKSDWRQLLADRGYLAPHWPKPWGRGANPVEQLVIDDEMHAAHVRRHHLQVGAWVLPTLIEHGTDEQQQRWIPSTLRGDVTWCQLFSEPGAGSDLASLTTKASRADGGWLLTGQKVWTTMAKESDWGLCLARTDPTVPKHEGISCFCVDMKADGIDIRPLRELTGFAMFNEVFLSDVFVPDDCVVGAVNDGWRAARTTLANERVSMGSGSSFGFGVEMLLGMVDVNDPVAVDEVGALLAEAQSLAVLGLRMTARAIRGADPGPESSVRKLLGVEHDQRVQEVGLALHGAQGAANDRDAASWVGAFFANRCLTIAGGTSEVQRNVIAERLLGLPKD